MHVKSSVAPNSKLVVALLKLLRFGIDAMANNGSQKRADWPAVFFESDDDDHLVNRIAQAMIGHAFANGVRPVDLRLWR